MRLKGRLIPDISGDEKKMLNTIRTESNRGAEWRDIAYAVMNQTLRGAQPQRDGIALKALSSKKDNSRIGPITIYSGRLDVGNIIELAIHPEKLADALQIATSDAEAWLAFLQESVANSATPKTSQRYPRVGIRSEDEFAAVLDAWDKLVARRHWHEYGHDRAEVESHVTPGTASRLEHARVEKAAQDAGFDLSVWADGEWLVLRSTAFPQEVGVSTHLNEIYRVGLSDAATDDQIRAEFGLQPIEAGQRWARILSGIPDYQTLHGALERIAAIYRVVAGAGLKEFEERRRKLPDTTEAVRLAVQRVGQDIFRSSLLEYWGGRCAVSGLEVKDLLRASHIKRWADCGSDAERLDVFNGLLLAPHFDALFDGGWVTFLDSGQILVADALDKASRDRLRVTGAEVIKGLADQHRAYLDWHREHCFRKCP